MKHGDFTALADNYARYRPGYSPFVLNAFLSLAERERERERETTAALTCADAGAGTGIWSRQLASAGVHVIAVEPNDAMRKAGEKQSAGCDILWRKGGAEHTGLPADSCDLVCMASSFHWPDFDAAVKEFGRILKPGGLFMALWNTRRFESNPLLVEIEDYLHKLVPELKRVSSGRSEFCNTLTDRLRSRKEFTDVLYVEGRHTEQQSQERYIGLWESVNDIRVQAGEERFARFIDHIKEVTRDTPVIEAEYLTRAWIAQTKPASFPLRE
ncbi:class I SAM-dependent methyltransferase [uncultured Mailhella sp.]|uniref:class I SAM-dependent methyltransferase n=1 Tax=uncultured Mailhella sp. TaxID=1981031 RepID=UPI00262F8F2E|nr:class I SAM-dependent methyltransferase [uncultured Mailhella sp.]